MNEPPAHPQMATSTDRWRVVGRDSIGDNYYLDVKSAEFLKPASARFWIKFVSKKATQTIRYEVDCTNLNSGWEEAIPDTLGEQLLNGACLH